MDKGEERLDLEPGQDCKC